MTYRIALDSGISSLGWALYKLDSKGNPTELLDGGVRIFDTAEPAEDRRLKRSARKNNTREKQRLDRVAAILAASWDTYKRDAASKHIFQAKQADLSEQGKALRLSPYKLRSLALDREISLAQLERILLHVAKHRGNSAVRFSGSDDDVAEGKAVLQAASKTRKLMEEYKARTYGELLWRFEKRGKSTKISKDSSSKKPEDAYAFYPLRSMIEDEFDQIIAAQKHYHQGITDELIATLKDEIFYERPKRIPDPGPCMFIENEPRLPRCNRLFQLKRLYEEVNNLRITDDGYKRCLTPTERDTLIAHLKQVGGIGEKDKTKGQDEIAKILNLQDHQRVSMGRKRNIKISPYPFDLALAADTALGDTWLEMSDAQQDNVLHILATEHDERELIKRLQAAGNLTEAQVFAVLQCDLPEHYSHMGQTATKAVLDSLMADPECSHQDALDQANFEAITHWTGGLLPRLPYYGEVLKGHVVFPAGLKSEDGNNKDNRYSYQEKVHGKIPNPVVHRALIQVRKLLNDIIKRYGPPTEIHLEISREMSMSTEERDQAAKQIEKNTKANDDIRKILKELGVSTSRKNLQLYKLWQRQQGQCTYTGDPINCNDLFGATVHVDHILPYSKTFDDGLGNKVVCTAQSNLDKGDRPPYDAFAHNGNYDWSALLRRVHKTIPASEWRFGADAMERFHEQDHGFGTAALNDTRYISRLMHFYLSCICPQNRIVTSNGRMTEVLRRAWGLDQVFLSHSPILQAAKAEGKVKDLKRVDHRHHFIDAVVIGGMTRSIVQRMQTAAARKTPDESIGSMMHRLFSETLPPIAKDDLHQQVGAQLARMMVSVKRNQKRQGEIHKETRWGLIQCLDADKDIYLARLRRKVADIKSFKDLTNIKIEDTVPSTPAVEKAKARIERLKTDLAAYAEPAQKALEDINAQNLSEGKKAKAVTEPVIFNKAKELYKQDKGITWYDDYSIKHKPVLARPEAGKNLPNALFVGGNNHRMDFYENAKGEVKWQCISLYDAMKEERKLFTPEVTLPGHRKLFSLFKGDTVEMTEPETSETAQTYKVLKFRDDKMAVLPILDARMEKDRGKPKEKGLRYYAERKMRQVVPSETGQMKWTSERLWAGKKAP